MKRKGAVPVVRSGVDDSIRSAAAAAVPASENARAAHSAASTGCWWWSWSGWGWWAEPVDVSSLAVLRMMWGMLHFLEAASYLANDGNKIKTHLMGRGWQAKYWGFDWVAPYETVDAFRVHFLVTMALGMCTTMGLCHRLASLGLLASLAYTFLLDMNNYLNHIYLMLLLQAIMCLAPANAKWSLDNVLFPSTRRDKVPTWSLSLLQWLMAIVYFYAGVAKMNEDWLQGEPLRHWLARRSHIPLLGPLLGWEPASYAFSYAGLVFDLLIPFALLARNPWVRGAGIVASLGFHLLNKLIFGIGVFPWLCVCLTTLYLPPDWPQLVVDLVQPVFFATGDDDPSSATLASLLAHASASRKASATATKPSSTETPATRPQQQGGQATAGIDRRKRRAPRVRDVVITAMVVTFLALQIAMPLRHMLYPGDVTWTEYGHRFSWRMKLRHKACEMEMFVERQQHHNPSLLSREPLRLDRYVTKRQARKMASRPDSLHQFALHLGHLLRQRGEDVTGIYASCNCTLNFRAAGAQPLVDPTYNLLLADPWEWPYPFVTPSYASLHA